MYKRIISVLTYNKGCLYRTKKFEPDYPYTSNFLDFWLIDEIVALDITRLNSKESRAIFYKVIKEISQNCFVPLAVGGNIRTLDEIDTLFELGADKIVINTKALEEPGFIEAIAKKYGSQTIIISIDAKKGDKGQYDVYKDFGSTKTSYTADIWAAKAVKMGAGEIMINSIEEDGSLNGYDVDLCKSVVEKVDVPVLISGGAGNWKHFEVGFNKIGASGVCTNNIFHFTENSIKNAKKYLKSKQILVRT